MTFLDVLRESPAWLYTTVGLLGLCVGSLLNVVIHRLPKMMQAQWRDDCAELEGREPEPRAAYNLFTPRSACVKCGTQITALQNIPVVSWLALRGRCATCGVPISARYPAVEALGAAIALLMAWRFGYSAALPFALVYGWMLIALTFIDFDTQLLPDDLTLPLLWGGLLANVFGLFAPLAEGVIGAIAGYLVLWSIYWLFRLIRGKEGMGYGDFKLLAALGAWLGWRMLPLVILGSSVVGAAIGIGLVVLKGRDHNVPLAFGPYLAIAGMIALFFGQPIVRVYFPN